MKYLDTTKDTINQLLNSIKEFEDINLSEIPSIDLYMDQVTTLMEEKLHQYKRKDEDKILTKTMINNYTKNKILRAPQKKKYSKSHMILFIFVYYLKQTLSIKDIGLLLDMINGDGSKQISNLEQIYEKFIDIKVKEEKKVIDDINSKVKDVKTEEDLFLLVASLMVQSNLQKFTAEKIIDIYYETQNQKTT